MEKQLQKYIKENHTQQACVGFIDGWEACQARENSSKLLLADVMPSFEYFKKYRKKLNLSMRDVTRKTGISIATISRLEQGNEVFYSNVKALYEFYRSNEA